MVNYSDCDCDHKFQWKEGKCKHENPISPLKHPIINRNDEKWQNEISPGADCWVARRPLSALGGLSARQVAEVGNMMMERKYLNTWFYSRSLPLPKLGLNNSCWNAGRSWDVDVCVGNLLLISPLFELLIRTSIKSGFMLVCLIPVSAGLMITLLMSTFLMQLENGSICKEINIRPRAH